MSCALWEAFRDAKTVGECIRRERAVSEEFLKCEASINELMRKATTGEWRTHSRSLRIDVYDQQAGRQEWTGDEGSGDAPSPPWYPLGTSSVWHDRHRCLPGQSCFVGRVKVIRYAPLTGLVTMTTARVKRFP